ncbi:MAG: hypothetical protein DWI29_02340 [Planctomycetota bacterium]|nr:MAG: hypothetical protein DWI29_02340 [Planctomycetota bacterium]
MSKHNVVIRHAARHQKSGGDRIRRDPHGSREFELGRISIFEVSVKQRFRVRNTPISVESLVFFGILQTISPGMFQRPRIGSVWLIVFDIRGSSQIVKDFSMFLARFKKLLLASAVMLGGLSGVASAQTTDTKVLSSEILPRDTYFYLSMPSVQGFKESFENSSSGRLFADPALEEFKAEVSNAFSSEMQDSLSQINDALGLTADELMAIPTGEVTIAVSKASSNKMGVIMFMDYGSHESEVKGLLEKASAALNDNDQLEAANVEHDGTELTMYTVTSDIAKQTPLAKEFGWFLKDERMVVSNSSALLKLTLDNWAGGSEKTLKSNAVYAYIMEKCESTPGAGQMTTFVDPVGMFTALVQTGSLGPNGAAAGMAIGFFPTLGIDQLKGIGSSGEMGGDEFDGVSRSFLYCEQPPQAAMQVFQLDAVDAVPPSWVKEDASVWMATKWKAGEAYTAIETLVDMFQGAGAFESTIDSLSEREPQVHIKKDVIDQLDGKMQVVISPGDRTSKAASDDMLFAIGVKDNQAFADLLNKLASQPGVPSETREVNGVTVYEIDPGTGQKISFTVANSQLLVAIGGNQLEQALRNDNDVRPLADSDDFKSVSGHFPDGALAVTFSRPAEQYRRLYDMLRDGEAAENFPGMEDLFAKIDFGKLPSFDVIEKYMAPTGGYWVGDENGVLMEQFTLKAE